MVTKKSLIIKAVINSPILLSTKRRSANRTNYHVWISVRRQLTVLGRPFDTLRQAQGSSGLPDGRLDSPIRAIYIEDRTSKQNRRLHGNPLRDASVWAARHPGGLESPHDQRDCKYQNTVQPIFAGLAGLRIDELAGDPLSRQYELHQEEHGEDHERGEKPPIASVRESSKRWPIPSHSIIVECPFLQ